MQRAAQALRYPTGVLVLAACLSQSAIACHEMSAPLPVTQERDSEGRTFLLDLQLSKSGSVRAVQVLHGVGALRTKAIRIASRQKYHPPAGYSQTLTTVEVTFPRGDHDSPKIHRDIALGVSSCVPGGIPSGSPLTPWVNQLLSGRSILPIPAPVADSKK